MRIACVGDVVALNRYHELVVLGPNPLRTPLRPLSFFSPAPGEPPQLMPAFDREPLALSPSGRLVAVRKESVRTVDVPGYVGLETTALVVDVVVVDVATRTARRVEGQALTFRTEEATLSIGPLPSGPPHAPSRGLSVLARGVAGPASPVTLPVPAPVAWPTGPGGVWRQAPPWQPGGLSTKSTLVSNAFGHVVTDALSGLVVRFDAVGSGAPSALRVPSEGAHSEIDIHACATPSGVLVGHSGGRSTGALNHFSTDGRHLGGVFSEGEVSEVGVLPRVAIFLREMGDFSGRLELVFASLPSLEVIEVVPTTLSPYGGHAGVACAQGGRILWIADGDRVERLERDTSGWQARPVDLEGVESVSLGEATASGAEAPPSVEPERHVMHPKFGRGRVVSRRGEGAEAKLAIEFADGTRTLLAKFVQNALKVATARPRGPSLAGLSAVGRRGRGCGERRRSRPRPDTRRAACR
jgi:hypothetical protein